MNPSSILDAVGNTPLVPLRRFSAGPATIWAKCEHLNPAGSIKDRIAKAIVEAAAASGELRSGGNIIEATAGNTGMGLAMVAAVHGYRVTCVLPEKMSEEKRRALRALGAEVIVTDNAPPNDLRNFQQVARRLAEERPDAVLADQFRNAANPLIHETTTGPEIWEQTRGRVCAFVAGIGTGGTITGVGRFLKSKNSDIRIVAADPLGSCLAGLINGGEPSLDAPYKVEGIGSSEAPDVLDLNVVDEAITIDDETSFATAARLVRKEGLLVGGSSGTAVAAATQLAQRKSFEGPIVVVLPDHWDRYPLG